MSYHTPKVYRSPFGCCICKAKSSSSRFTDSSRYESDFSECFKLEEPRYGEICNACVLLIKRWKKLPVGSKRNWNHVVDARARPRGRGTARYIRKSTRARSPAESEDHYIDDRLSEASINSVPSSRAPSPSPSPSPFSSEDDVSTRSGSSKRKQEMPLRSKYKYYRYEDFINYGYWRKVKVCCGYVFFGSNDVVLIDPSLFKPCCPVNVGSDNVSSEIPDNLGSSGSGGVSDGGSHYEDEDSESLDDVYSVDSFYRPDERTANLLTQLAAAIGT